MKCFSIFLLLGVLLSRAVLFAATPRPATVWQLSAPEAEFNRIGNGMMAVVQRALNQPTDADAIALLQKEGAPLRQQAQLLRPTYAKWFSGLSAREKAGVQERIQRSSFGTYFGTLETDPQLSTRIKSNPTLNQAMNNLTGALKMR